ncbi:unnamed protein product [Calypogeia fissa]
MAPEEDPDDALVVDWRFGTSYAEKLIVSPLPEQFQQTVLPFKQKKATSSSETATDNKMTTMVAVKNESFLKASSGDGGGVNGGVGVKSSLPVFYDLSDSDGTPIRPQARISVKQRAAVVPCTASTSHKPIPNAGLVCRSSTVILSDSDSDDEVIPKATLKPSVNFERLGTQGGSQLLKPCEQAEKFRQSVSQGALLVKAISLNDEGSPSSRFSGMVDKPTQSPPPGGFLGRDPSPDSERMVASTSIGTDLHVALRAATAYVADLPLVREDESHKAGPSTRFGPIAASPNGMSDGNVRTSNDYMQTTYAVEVPTMLPLAVEDEAEKAGPSTRTGPIVAKSIGMKDANVGPSNGYVQTTCPPAVPNMWAPSVEVMRNCLQGTGPVLDIEETRFSSPVQRQPAVHDLTSDDDGGSSDPEWLRLDVDPISTRGSFRDGERLQLILPNTGGDGGVNDHNDNKKRPLQNRSGLESHENGREHKRRCPPDQAAVMELSSDDDGGVSDPSWMRDYSPVPIRGGLNVGSSRSHESRGKEINDQFLPTSVGNSDVGDQSVSRRRPSMQIPGLESPENYASPSSPNVNDLDSPEEAPKRKRGRAKKAPLSEEERAAREAQKQRDKESKQAQKEQRKEELKRQKEELRRQKDAEKAAAAGKKRSDKQEEEWQKGKNALRNTTMYIDTRLIDSKPIGSLLLSQITAKNYTYKSGENPIEHTVVWRIKRPPLDSQVEAEGLGSQADDAMNSQRSNCQEVEMQYVAVVLQGEEFARMVADNEIEANLSKIRKKYPTYSVCYLISGLKKFLQKKEQRQYRTGDKTWTRPNVEKVLAEFITNYIGVNARLCIDECEVADHVVGLTRGLAESPFKKKLSSISVDANGEHVCKSDPNKAIVKTSLWMKFLCVIDGVNGATAIAIANKYPTMRALLKVYLDESIGPREKERLLESLVKDTGGTRNLIGATISKRIYRIFTARNGNLSTEEVEEGPAPVTISVNDD